MNIALILFTLGVIMVVSGYTNQVSPHCNTKLKVKVVPRGVYDEILYNQELTDSAYNDMISGEGEEDDEGITIE